MKGPQRTAESHGENCDFAAAQPVDKRLPMTGRGTIEACGEQDEGFLARDGRKPVKRGGHGIVEIKVAAAERVLKIDQGASKR